MTTKTQTTWRRLGEWLVLAVDAAAEVRTAFRRGLPMARLIEAPCMLCTESLFVSANTLNKLEREAGGEVGAIVCKSCFRRRWGSSR